MLPKKTIFHIFPILFNLVIILALLLGGALIVTPVYAAGITVNTTTDEDNTGADCSLREAITAANTDAAYGGCAAGSGTDTITLSAGTYTLTIAGVGEDANATGDLDITDSLAINGVGSTIIQAGVTPGAGIDRIFDVIGATSVSISDVTITNGKCTTCNGGGILNSGMLTVTNSTLSGNTSLYGGGISNNGGTLTVMNSTFSENSGAVGGGVHINGGTVTVINSTLSANSAGFGGQGGGIYNYDGNLTVTNSTFSANFANYGGGIMNFGALVVTNSTLSSNSAFTQGGGIYNGVLGDTLTLNNSILANSTVPGIKDCINDSGTVSGTNNLIEVDGSGLNACGTTSPINSDPSLGVLADNGGPTQTFAIPSTSSAYNAGDNATCAATDQRGVTRPQGGQCDIGAYEKAPIFADVSLSYWSNSYIERLYNAGITGGCSTSPLSYCPTNSVTRAQMAIFLLRGMHGSTYTPPAATGTVFNDVPLGAFGAAWIEQLATEGITSGCGGGNYCPNTTVSRAQMVIFLVRAKHGIAFVPPTATGIFLDVPVGSFGANFIEQLVTDAITSGCGNGNFCPNTMVKRDSMAVFLVKTFNLP